MTPLGSKKSGRVPSAGLKYHRDEFTEKELSGRDRWCRLYRGTKGSGKGTGKRLTLCVVAYVSHTYKWTPKGYKDDLTLVAFLTIKYPERDNVKVLDLIVGHVSSTR